ncbi:MAG: phosphoheptose isomerase [Candidatus Nealsonbacteria bacterium RIFCSPLOWO2_01_FULL_41_9]|uniref:Phosphoheptose isomerase n=1 Tax=Candidatus Nealsonbacteria bacterium RIFCSPLOWO2_01_FULL_41_9 TaxID=1801671 RepID=A0A1G2ED44_9BACT|nr:MAG: phosphoheptose isomerase [Candidatus Nealsonbacteria bacterium RIFCSPLOWO2_01_FULL_41_9]
MKKQFNQNIELHKVAMEQLSPKIAEAAELIIQAFKTGKKLLLCGNGGSAADSQHIAAEFVGRFKKERKGLPAIALTTDTSIMTAVANDYWYELLFARQVETLGAKDDVLIAISTSGNSQNIIRAVEMANFQGLKTIGFLGGDGGKLKDLVRIPIVVPFDSSDRIQEVHIFIGHVICDLVESNIV